MSLKDQTTTLKTDSSSTLKGATPSTTSTSGSTLHGSSTSSTSVNDHGFSGFHVPYILSWKNPHETGVLLAESLGAVIIFGTSFTLRFFLKFAAYTISLFSLIEWGSRSISGQRNGLVSSYQPSRFLPFNDSFINDLSKSIAQLFSRASYGVQHLVDARDPAKGLKIGGVLYLSYVLLTLFPLRGLLLTVIILAFTIPPLYLQFEPEIDKTIGKIHGHVHAHFTEVGNKIHAKAGPQIDLVRKYVGPRGGFPGTANANPVTEIPTAGAKQKSTGVNSSAAADSVSSAGLSSSSIPSRQVPVTAKSTTVTPNATTTTTTTSAAHVPDDVFKNFDSVPTLTGNLPIDHEKLTAALAADKAKFEGSRNNL